jgi:hypothetical protein
MSFELAAMGKRATIADLLWTDDNWEVALYAGIEGASNEHSIEEVSVLFALPRCLRSVTLGAGGA